MIHTHIAPGEIRERVIPTENDRRQKASSKKALVSHSFHINACTVLKINLNVFFYISKSAAQILWGTIAVYQNVLVV